VTVAGGGGGQQNGGGNGNNNGGNNKNNNNNKQTNQLAVAYAMNAYAADVNPKPSFVVALGDK